jgi:hypothetical protein
MLAPAVGLAILALGLCLALVLDKLWLDAARSELQTAAEAGALAAAGRLADDDCINPAVEPSTICANARLAAATAAAQNPVGGRSLLLDTSIGGDVRLGKLARNSLDGGVQFLETENYPTSVAVLANRTRAIGNPVARFFSGLTGSTESAAVLVEATVNNRILGVRPISGGPVPALPLAVLEVDPTGNRADTWVAQIESGLGADRYRFNPETKQVEEGPDGLPEIELHFLPPGGRPDEANAQLVDLGTRLNEEYLARQTVVGWTDIDLADLDGELRTDGQPLKLAASARLYDRVAEELHALLGQKRIILLYDGYAATGGELGEITVSRLVSGRVMALGQAEDGSPVIVLQAAVVATRTALVLDPDGTAHDDTEFTNPYVYKISLTQ